jgi:hypothetical protein
MQNETITLLLSNIEQARRNEDYVEMERKVGVLQGMIVNNDSLPTREVLARLFYEQHMACYQRAKKLLHESMSLAEQSAEHARAVGDPVGALFAQANIGGLLLPALGKPYKGLDLSSEIYGEAVALAESAPNAESAARAHRVAVNCLLHQTGVLMAIEGEDLNVQKLFQLVEANPLYQELKGKPEGWGDLTHIKKYLGLTD